ncbi:MAG: hypothetical protein WAL50_16150 [Kineosporiaceae bacterium]
MVSHVGSALLRLLGDKVGLTAALSKALRVRGFHPDIDRGRLLADLAVAVADGATAIDDLKALRDQGDLFGPVASTTTAWRCLDLCRDRDYAEGVVVAGSGGLIGQRSFRILLAQVSA